MPNAKCYRLLSSSILYIYMLISIILHIHLLTSILTSASTSCNITTAGSTILSRREAAAGWGHEKWERVSTTAITLSEYYKRMQTPLFPYSADEVQPSVDTRIISSARHLAELPQSQWPLVPCRHDIAHTTVVCIQARINKCAPPLGELCRGNAELHHHRSWGHVSFSDLCGVNGQNDRVRARRYVQRLRRQPQTTCCNVLSSKLLNAMCDNKGTLWAFDTSLRTA